jgi:hypothetical protein
MGTAISAICKKYPTFAETKLASQKAAGWR